MLRGIVDRMVKEFFSGLAKGAALGLIGGVVATGLVYGLMAVGMLGSTGALAGIYGFVTSGGAFNPWGLIAFSTVFGASGQAVADVVKYFSSPATPQVAEHRPQQELQDWSHSPTIQKIRQPPGQGSHLLLEQARRANAEHSNDHHLR